MRTETFINSRFSLTFMAKELEEDTNEEDVGVDEEEEDLYTEGGTEEAMEADEIDELEEGFMKGYEGGDRLAKCALCKKPLQQTFVEEELNGDMYRFCSEEHADAFIRKATKEE